MTTDLPSWVPEFEEEYTKFRKKNKILWITGLVLTGIFLLGGSEVKNNSLLSLLNFALLIIGMFLFTIYFNKKVSGVSKYLASMIYSIGFNLEKNSDPESKIYISNMENYLKNCDAIIGVINNSLISALYVKSTKDYLKKLRQTIRLLNEYYNNYTKYEINKSEIVGKIINLANLIHKDAEYVMPEHFAIINSLVNDFTHQNVKEKPLHISKTEKIISVSKGFIGGVPYTIKLIIYIILVFSITYELINFLALSKGITQDTAFGYAIAGGIGALVPALMVKEHLLK